MTNFHTVTLEFLRQGPPNNQLLSPLTDYLTNCGNFDTAVVHVPWEHARLMRALKSLRYVRGFGDGAAADRNEVINSLAGDIAGLLGGVQGLAATAAVSTSESTEPPIVHINLVISASELAMLPFELSKVPPGCIGRCNEHWLLQESPRVCLTRQIRSVSREGIKWPKVPNILFLAASPPGFKAVPMKEHYEAMVRAIGPYLGLRGSKAELKSSIAKVVTFLPNASRDAIARACQQAIASNKPFTHVHILAHGMEDPKREGKPYGLALHDNGNSDKPDVISGEDFAAFFRPLPTVLTVASCDSGNVGDVVYSGASFAHEVHQAGIPFVCASQFPLTFSGSVTMVNSLYSQLLEGTDPREAICELRRQLQLKNASRVHDWASLVVYAALPYDLERQLERSRYAKSKQRFNAAMIRADGALNELRILNAVEPDASVAQKIEATTQRIDEALADGDEASEAMPTEGPFDTEGLGMKASYAKQKAERYFNLAKTLGGESADADNLLKGAQTGAALRNSYKALKEASDFYQKAVRQNLQESKGVVKKRSLHWVLGQSLSIQRILGLKLSSDEWCAARLSAMAELSTASPAWAHGTLAELYLIHLGTELTVADLTRKEVIEKACAHIKELVKIVKPDSYEIKSTRRQLQRYTDWWLHDAFAAYLKKENEKDDNWMRNVEPLKVCVQAMLDAMPTTDA